jgi:hypothetical protein
MQVAISPFNRSSITNGKRRHRRGTVDGRTHAARRWRDLYLGFVGDLGRKPSVADDACLRQAATLALQSEQLTTNAAAGGRIDSAELTSLCSELRRVLKSVGLSGDTAAEPDAAARREHELREAGLA